MNTMLSARQTLELCANPSCPNPNNFACDLFGGGGCRQYLRKSIQCFTCRPHNWVLYIHTSCMRELPALKQASCLELRVAGNWKATKLQTSCFYAGKYYIPWSELTSVFQCIAENFDEILCSWKKNHSTLQNIYLWRKVVCFVL
jgi:hypothetical protein